MGTRTLRIGRIVCLLACAPSLALPTVTAVGGKVDVGESAFEYERTADGRGKSGFSAVWRFPEWEKDTWVFLPACAYGGNRAWTGIPLAQPVYPPGPTERGFGPEPRLEMTETIPALKPDGSGVIEVTAGDMAVPCAGFFFPGRKRGVLIFTEAQVCGEPLGFTVKAGELKIDYPANRSAGYRFNGPSRPHPDRPVELDRGARIRSRYRRIDFEAANVSAFIERFFRERKCVMSSPRAKNLYTKELWEVVERCWNEKLFVDGAYCQERVKWVPGWAGGPQCVYPLYRFGDERTRQRCRQTLDFMCERQTKAGVFYGCRVGPAKTLPVQKSRQAGDELTQFFRMHCDGVWNLLRCMETMGATPKWKAAAEKGADALVRAWRKNGQFGQWVDPETLDLIVGRSDACVIAPAALVEAWKVFRKPEYLEVAKAACEDYCVRDLDRGVLYGAAADEIMAPESESALQLLESCMALHEVTGEGKWIARARQCAAFLSTWVMTYAYEFPPDSALARQGVNSTGSVFANIQNKHSAPGYATLSGRGLLELYRKTGDRDYLELLKDTAFFLPQAVSRAEKPYVACDGRALDPGFMCERVNTSDWEGKENVGGSIFYASCWCGTSLLTTWADLIGEPEFGASVVTRRETAMGLRPDYDVYKVADAPCGSLAYENGVLHVKGRKGGLKIHLACAFPGSRPFLAPGRIVLRTKGAVPGTVELSIGRLDRKKGEKRTAPWTDETVFDFGLSEGQWKFGQLVFTPSCGDRDYEFDVLSLTAVAETEPARALAFDVDTGNAIHTTVDIRAQPPVYVFRNLADVPVAAKGTVVAESYYGDRIVTPVDGVVDPGADLRVPVDFSSKTGPRGRFHGLWTAHAVLESASSPITNETRFAVLNRNARTPRFAPDKFKMGICYHESFYSDGDRRTCLEALNACGAKLVRSLGFSADDCWHRQDNLDFSKTDAYMRELKEAGISLNASLNGWPEWMVDPGRKKPKMWPPWYYMRPKPGVLGDYAAKLAARYGGDIEMLEVGNEWDIVAPDDTITIDEAVDLQKEVYRAIRSVTKDIKVLPSSWAQADSANPLVHARRKGFQEQVMAKAKGYYDVHPTHQYAVQSQYEKDMVNKFFEWRKKAGIDAQWYAAETSICPCVGVDDALARNVWMKILWSWAHGSVGYIWYNLRCTGWRTDDNEESYGLLDASYHPKIGFAAFSALANTVSGLDFDRILCEKKGRHLYGFKGERQGVPVYVIAGWDHYSTGPVDIVVKSDAERAFAVNLMGDAREIDKKSGAFVFTIGDRPGALVLKRATKAEPNGSDVLKIAEPKVRVIEAKADIENRPPDFHLFNWWMVREYWAGNPLTQHRMWKNADDLSPAVWIGRKGDDLLVRFKVRDDIHCQRMKPAYLWLSDGLQFILESPGQRGNYEIGFAMTNEGKPIVHLWSVPAGYSIGKVKAAIRLATWRDTDIQTWYSARIPLAAIGFTEKTLSDGFRFNAIFYDDDGDGDEKDIWSLRDTSIEIAPGITTDKDYSQSPIVKIK